LGTARIVAAVLAGAVLLRFLVAFVLTFTQEKRHRTPAQQTPHTQEAGEGIELSELVVYVRDPVGEAAAASGAASAVGRQQAQRRVPPPLPPRPTWEAARGVPGKLQWVFYMVACLFAGVAGITLAAYAHMVAVGVLCDVPDGNVEWLDGRAVLSWCTALAAACACCNYLLAGDTRMLGRVLVWPILILAALADCVLVRFLWRDIIAMPAHHIARRDPLGLLLHVLLQVPHSACFTFFIGPFWAAALVPPGYISDGDVGIVGLSPYVFVPTLLAALPFATAVRGRRGLEMLADTRYSSGGALPIDWLVLAAVRRSVGAPQREPLDELDERELAADVNAVDHELYDGQGALHYAARHGLHRTVHALLHLGADPCLKDTKKRKIVTTVNSSSNGTTTTTTTTTTHGMVPLELAKHQRSCSLFKSVFFGVFFWYLFVYRAYWCAGVMEDTSSSYTPPRYRHTGTPYKNPLDTPLCKTVRTNVLYVLIAWAFLAYAFRECAKQYTKNARTIELLESGRPAEAVAAALHRAAAAAREAPYIALGGQAVGAPMSNKMGAYALVPGQAQVGGRGVWRHEATGAFMYYVASAGQWCVGNGANMRAGKVLGSIRIASTALAPHLIEATRYKWRVNDGSKFIDARLAVEKLTHRGAAPGEEYVYRGAALESQSL
jgi:hypothetical protein